VFGPDWVWSSDKKDLTNSFVRVGYVSVVFPYSYVMNAFEVQWLHFFTRLLFILFLKTSDILQ